MTVIVNPIQYDNFTIKAAHPNMTTPKAITYGKVNIIWRIHYNYRLMFIMCSVFISYFICRSPIYTLKTHPDGRPAAMWLNI